MLRATKYRIYPTEEQKVLLEKHFGCARLIYNFGLDLKNKTYQETGKSISRYDIQKLLPELKKTKEFLSEVNSASLQSSLINLETAFTKFFKKTAKYPNFKSKYSSKQSFQLAQSVYVVGNKLDIPKFKQPIKIVVHRPIVGEIKTCTISRTLTNKYFISVLMDDGINIPDKLPLDFSKAVGLDLGIKTFVTLSTGEKFDNPKCLSKREKYLARQQRILSRKKKGSKNRTKQKLVIAKIHEKITNQRKDFHHKLSRKIVDENQVICIEDLSVKNMVQNRKLSKSISDCGWGQFVSFIHYKANWKGHSVIKIGRFDPSSKMCSCGKINNNLQLSDRTWTCKHCGVTHDREVLAAKNILKFATLQQNLLGQELPDVKPPEKLSSSDLRKMIVKTTSVKEEKFNRTKKLVKLKPLGL